MIAPKIIDKNTVTASNVANTSAEVGRMRLRSSRRAEADKPVQEHKQVFAKICIYSSNLSKYHVFFFCFWICSWAVSSHAARNLFVHSSYYCRDTYSSFVYHQEALTWISKSL